MRPQFVFTVELCNIEMVANLGGHGEKSGHPERHSRWDGVLVQPETHLIFFNGVLVIIHFKTNFHQQQACKLEYIYTCSNLAKLSN